MPKKKAHRSDKLELHMGEDYAVAMLPGDVTDEALINFGCSAEDAFCEEVVKRYNAHEDLARNLARANTIIGWMMPYIGSMCPPDGGLGELNEHFMENRVPTPGDETKGAPIKQRAIQ